MEQQESCETPATTGVKSNKEHPTSMAPPDYRPTLESRTMVHDDELLDLPAMMDGGPSPPEAPTASTGSEPTRTPAPTSSRAYPWTEGARHRGQRPPGAQFDNPCDGFQKAGVTCGSAGPGDNAARRKEDRT